MAIPRFFKLPQYKRFNYQPLYYDPKKEEREERNKEIERELGIKREGESTYRTSIRKGSMKEYFDRGRRVQRQSNIRLVLIIIFLLFVAYLILYR